MAEWLKQDQKIGTSRQDPMGPLFEVIAALAITLVVPMEFPDTIKAWVPRLLASLKELHSFENLFLSWSLRLKSITPSYTVAVPRRLWHLDQLSGVKPTDIYKTRLLMNQNKSEKLITFKTYIKEPIFQTQITM